MTTLATNRLVVPLAEAAHLMSCSTQTLRRAILGNPADTGLPPLRGKRDSKGRITVKVSDLIAWHDALPDA